MLRALRKSIDATLDRASQGQRQSLVRDRFGDRPNVPGEHETALRRDRLQELFSEERVAFAAVMDPVTQLAPDWMLSPEGRAHERCRLVARQGRELQGFREVAPLQLVQNRLQRMSAVQFV